MIVIFSAISFTANASDFEIDGICYNVTSFTELTCSVTSKETGYNGEIVIPNTVDYAGRTLTVTALESAAFMNNRNLLSVELNSEISSIENKTFFGCSSLTSVHALDEIRVIGKEAFMGCEKLTSVILPKGVQSIGARAFFGCKALNTFSVPNITIIEAETFSNCVNLNSISLPETITKIGQQAFQGCSSLTEFIIPNSVTSVESAILSNCTGLLSVTLGNGITQLTSQIFGGCNSLESLYIVEGDKQLICYCNDKLLYGVYSYEYAGYFSGINLKTVYLGRNVIGYRSNPINSDNVITYGNPFARNKSIETIILTGNVTDLPAIPNYKCMASTTTSANELIGSFQGCSNLKEVIIESPIKKFDINMFKECSQLEDISMPNSVTIVGDEVFQGCSSLKSISIGCNCTSIGARAFSDCDNIEKISILSSVPPKYSTGFNNSQYISINLRIPPNTKDTYSQAEPWANFWNMEEDISLIASFTYDDIKYEVAYGDNVAIIGNEIKVPEDITIPDEVVYQGRNFKIIGIESNAFRDCEFMTAIDISSEIKFIGEKAFMNCSALNEISIPGSCLSIGMDAFNGCTSLKKIHFKYGIEKLTLSAQSTSILGSEFYPFPNPSTVDERRTGFRYGYYNGLFENLPIEKIIIERDIISACYYQRKEGAAIYPYSTVYNEMIYYSPFYNLPALREVIIGDKVTQICENTIEATYRGSPTTMDYSTFGMCNNIAVVIAENSIAPIGGQFSNKVYASTPLFLPNGGKSTYLSDKYWKNFSLIIEDDFIRTEEVLVSPSEKEMIIGEVFELNMSLIPSNSSISRLIWSSSNDKVAKVEDGIITAVREGSAVISGMTTDGTNLSAQCAVTVTRSLSIEDIEEYATKYFIIEDNCIRIINADSASICIYNLSGQKVYESVIQGYEKILLNKGVYIVRINNESKKVIIK